LAYDNTAVKEGTYSALATARSNRAIAVSDFLPSTGDFSFCAWIRPSNYTAANPDYFGSRALGAFGALPGIAVGSFGSSVPKKLGLVLDNGAGDGISVHSETYFTTVGIWYAVVATVRRAPQTILLYRQGSNITSSCTHQTVGTGNVEGDDLTGVNVTLNNRPGTDTRGAYCRYDDIRIYNRVLTPQEVMDYYNQVLPAK
jgi:hypothetical protein